MNEVLDCGREFLNKSSAPLHKSVTGKSVSERKTDLPLSCPNRQFTRPGKSVRQPDVHSSEDTDRKSEAINGFKDLGIIVHDLNNLISLAFYQFNHLFCPGCLLKSSRDFERVSEFN